jgi:nitrogen fixation NifU-like protein
MNPNDLEQQIYKENILDHYRNPHNAGRLDGATFSHHEMNTSCGDHIELFVVIGRDGTVENVRFDGRGCAVSQASASMLTDAMKGMAEDELRKLGPEDVLKLLGVPVGPTRLKCALLSLKTLQKGLDVWHAAS